MKPASSRMRVHTTYVLSADAYCTVAAAAQASSDAGMVMTSSEISSNMLVPGAKSVAPASCRGVSERRPRAGPILPSLDGNTVLAQPLQTPPGSPRSKQRQELLWRTDASHT